MASHSNEFKTLPHKPRRSRPKRPYVPRCDWCDEPMPLEREAVYCSNKCRQAAYRLRKKAQEERDELTQLKAEVKQLLRNQHILEGQLDRAERRADEWIAAESVRVWKTAKRLRQENGHLKQQKYRLEQDVQELHNEVMGLYQQDIERMRQQRQGGYYGH